MSQTQPGRQGITMAVTHLNAPYGPVVCAEDVSNSFCHGEIRASSAKAAAILSYLFVEVEPRLVMRCATEAGATLLKANQLYTETVKSGAPRSSLWESSMRDLL